MSDPEVPDFFHTVRISIFGLGLMGGSLALALRGRCAHLTGYDPDLATLRLAETRGVVDEAYPNASDALAASDLAVLAAPVKGILEWLQLLPNLAQGEMVVLDLGSTKREICKAMERLPERFDPIGGHPMCGKEIGGLEQAEGELFSASTFAFTPLPRTTPRAIVFCKQLSQAIGAFPIFLDPNTHDRWVAATSHVPYLLAVALGLATPIESAQLMGSGFQSTSRVGKTPSSMMLDVLLTNQDNVLEALENFRGEIQGLEKALSEQDEAGLRKLLEAGAQRLRTELAGTR